MSPPTVAHLKSMGVSLDAANARSRRQGTRRIHKRSTPLQIAEIAPRRVGRIVVLQKANAVGQVEDDRAAGRQPALEIETDDLGNRSSLVRRPVSVTGFCRISPR